MFDLYMHIEGLGKARGYKNMTVLCRAANVGRASMTELKMGRSKSLSKTNAEKLAACLGVTLDELYGTEKPSSTQYAGGSRQQLPDPETLRLLELLESREDIRYLAVASEKATPEHVRATAKMFDELYGKHGET